MTILRSAPDRIGLAGDDLEAEAGVGGMIESPSTGRADEMIIDRSRSGVEWGIIGLLIGLAGGLGIGLARRE